MASKLLSAPFPLATSYGMNFFDQTPVNLGAGNASVGGGWSPGAQLVTEATRPATVKVWTLIGWGVNFKAAISLIGEPGVQPFLSTKGQLYAGLTRGGAVKGDGAFTGMPPDASLVELLWDGNTDPPFPMNSSQSAVAPSAISERSHKTVFPAPLELDPDDTLQVGFWLTPSLGQNVRLWFYQASYTLIYDPTT